MRIHLAIVGLARSIEFCYPSIEQNISGPIRACPALRLSQSVTLSHSSAPLNNERTGEFRPATLDANFVHSVEAATFAVEELREETSSLFRFSLQAGEWLNGSGRNLRNYLEFLALLEKANETVQAKSPDVVIFLRPDVLVVDRFIPVRGINISAKAMLTPRWGKFHGLNDRMAVLPGEYAHDYLSRIRSVREFIRHVGPFNPEKHLAWAMRKFPSKPTLRTELIRIRAGGVLAEKDMERLESAGPFRRAQAKRLRLQFPPLEEKLGL